MIAGVVIGAAVPVMGAVSSAVGGPTSLLLLVAIAAALFAAPVVLIVGFILWLVDSGRRGRQWTRAKRATLPGRGSRLRDQRLPMGTRTEWASGTPRRVASGPSAVSWSTGQTVERWQPRMTAGQGPSSAHTPPSMEQRRPVVRPVVVATSVGMLIASLALVTLGLSMTEGEGCEDVICGILGSLFGIVMALGGMVLFFISLVVGIPATIAWIAARRM